MSALRELGSGSTAARRLHAGLILLRHRLSGGAIPPPRPVKTSVVRWLQWRYGCRTFVETGTFHGRMLAAVRRDFDRLFSIELSPELHRNACARFRGDDKIELLQGDSADLLPTLLARIESRCLFWLDGHYSGPGTARAGRDTPLVAELRAIAAAGRRGDVILIDDLRLLGAGDYPTWDEVGTLLRAIDPRFEVTAWNDMVVALPPSRRPAERGPR